MSFGEIVFALVMSGIFGLWLYGIIVTDGDTIRRILWDDTMLGWGWRKLFGEKKKAKQAPMIFTSAPPPPANRIATAGTYGRWAFAYDVTGSSTSVTADEYAVSAKIGQASGPGTATPTWGGATNGTGNMWLTTAGDIYIYS